MSVYVDELQAWPGKPDDPRAARIFGNGRRSCHMSADTLDELHAMAERIGMRRSWFQDHPLMPHYDLTPSRRAAAVAAGAIEMTRREQAKARAAKRLALEMADQFTEEAIRERLRDTAYVVEATHEESHTLWLHNAREAADFGYGPNPRQSWEQLNPGWIVTIGALADMPVTMSCWWFRIDGRLVLFWELTSQVADYRMARPWLNANCPAAAERRTTQRDKFRALPARDRGHELHPDPRGARWWVRS